MKPYYVLLLAIASLLASCGGNGQNNDTVTFSPDSMAETSPSLDTATALPEEPIAPALPKSNIDSLASAEEALAFMQNSGHWDEYSQGIIPSVLKQNVDYGRRLINNRFDHFIIVDKQSMHVILYDRYGREVKSYLMACSRYYGTKHKRRDNRTPEGFFYAGSTYDSTDWLYTDDDGHTSQVKGQFGPRFIRVKNPVSNQIGIHGTAARYSPGRRASHGCIRLLNENILDLVQYVHAGMPIIVNPSDRDQKVNKEEDCNVVQLNIGKPKHSTADADAERLKAEKATADSIKAARKAEEERLKVDSIAKAAAEAEKANVPENPEPDDEPTDPFD